LTNQDGTVYNGAWVNDKMHGVGEFSSKNAKPRKGEWANGERVKWL